MIINQKPKLLPIEGHRSNKKGCLFSIEDHDIGMNIRRVFYITDFSKERFFNNRGNHSHANSSQYLVNIKGEVSIKVIDIFSLEEFNFTLNSPSQCLFLPPNHHIFMNHYSEDAVMMVLCDKNYSEDEINNYHMPDFLDIFKDAAEFTNRTLKDIIDTYNDIYDNYPGLMKFKQLTDFEFKCKFDGKTPSEHELYEFYKNTPNYILELTEYHSTHARSYLTQQVIRRMHELGVNEVLDFGCGIGEDSLQMITSGINTTMCDIPSKTFEFAKWRLGKRNRQFSCVEIGPDGRLDLPKEKKFDAVICFEVLMHVPDPLKTLDLLDSLLNFGGYLFLTYRFEGNYSLALEKNKEVGGVIGNKIIERGFLLHETVPAWEGKNMYIYKKSV